MPAAAPTRPYPRSALLAAAALAVAAPAPAQLRGLPVFFDPSYSWDTRVGIDVGHGGEADGLAVAATASHLFLTGNCKRIAVSGGAGIFDPRGDADPAFNAGGSASVLLNPCPFPTSVPNPTFRLFAGAGMVRTGGRSVANVPVGIAAGYLLEVPIGRIELWTTPRAHYRERIAGARSDGWDFAVSAGLDIGVGAVAGLRAGLDCCEGGVGGGYGLSLWF